ncbi:MAG TPA: dTDP-glucose 4,6-dehydratase [Candidatus Cybelea sp.]
MRLLVTGGAGFIGSALVRQVTAETRYELINLDKLTYAGSLASLGDAGADPRHVFERIDICDRGEVDRVFAKYAPDAVIHLAAESHVDRSISGPATFVRTNVVGSSTLLEAATTYWAKRSAAARDSFRFVHVSTDEVYGDIGWDGAPRTEESKYAPSSPYAASKAASDHLARAWCRTYGLPVVVVNASNNYGPYQYPEKLIPLVITKALQRDALPVYGNGKNIRDWLYVEDHARALRAILLRGVPGRTYNVSGRSARTNIAVVHAICALLDELRPDPAGPYRRLVGFVADRPGHDRRYAVDDTRIATEIGWQPRERFETGLEKTVRWYLDNAGWARNVLNAASALSARGLPPKPARTAAGALT